LVLQRYYDIAKQSADNLVDGLTSLSEKHYDYSNYTGKTFEKANWIGEEGYICPSNVHYARPLRALNVDGEWRAIIQDIAWPRYTQTQRVETCLFSGSSCRTLAPCYGSKCYLGKYLGKVDKTGLCVRSVFPSLGCIRKSSEVSRRDWRILGAAFF
jgi:hypothetical protein